MSERATAEAVDPQCCDPTGEQARMMSDELREDVLLRLRKVGGQEQGVARMVEKDRYCVDVLQQLSAVQAAVDAVSKAITRNTWSAASPAPSAAATHSSTTS